MPKLPILGHGQAAAQLRRGVNMPDWAWGVAAMLATFVGTGLARRYALRKQLLDQPGERRNHLTATPRGGGIAMLVVLLVVIILLAAVFPSEAMPMALMGISLALVGGVGWWDDHRPLSVGFRLGAHGVAALCLFIAGMLEGWPLWLSLLSAIAAMVLINIWNFMDGIDGIAASQAALIALVIGLLATGAGQVFAFALMGAALGFLVWNFPKARIFMGDVGSGVLGIAVAWGWASTAAIDPMFGLVLLFPLAPFLVDAGFTLARRVLRGERWWQAHSSHSYQLLARRLGQHVPVTIGYLVATAIGAMVAWWLVSKDVKITFIWLALAAWYIALVIIWRVIRTPAMDKANRSKE